MNDVLADVDLVLDELGRLCPLPVISLARHIADVPSGGLVAVLADDPAARGDVEAWCGLQGHDYVGTRETARGPAYVVRRRA